MFKKIFSTLSLCALSSMSFGSQEEVNIEDIETPSGIKCLGLSVPQDIVTRLFSEVVRIDALESKGHGNLVEDDFLDKIRLYSYVSKGVRAALLTYKKNSFSFIPREPVLPEALIENIQPNLTSYVDAFLLNNLTEDQINVLEERSVQGRLSYANEELCFRDQPRNFYVQNCTEDLKRLFEDHEHSNHIFAGIDSMEEGHLYKFYRMLTYILKSQNSEEEPGALNQLTAHTLEQWALLSRNLPKTMYDRLDIINSSLGDVSSRDIVSNVITVATPYLQPWMPDEHIRGIIAGLAYVQEGVERELFVAQVDYTHNEAISWTQTDEGVERNTLNAEGNYLYDWMSSGQVCNLFSFDRPWNRPENDRNSRIMSIVPQLYEEITIDEVLTLINNLDN